MPNPLFSTYDQEENQVTGTVLSVFEHLSIGLVEDVLELAMNESVAAAIEAHMGPWYEGPEPSPGSLQDLVHVADMIASAKNIEVRLPRPVPEELRPYSPGPVNTGPGD